MKHQKRFLFLALLGIGLVSVSFTLQDKDTPEAGASKKVFKLFYIDNSKPGLSAEMVNYIYEKTDTLRDNQCLLYSSNGLDPFYTKVGNQMKEKLFKTDGYTQFPDCFFDKKKIINLMGTNQYNDIAALKIYFFLTEEYLIELLKKKPASLLRFLPEELSLLTKIPEANIEVNICYSVNPVSVNIAELKQSLDKLNFYNNGKYQSAIKYQIIQK